MAEADEHGDGLRRGGSQSRLVSTVSGKKLMVEETIHACSKSVCTNAYECVPKTHRQRPVVETGRLGGVRGRRARSKVWCEVESGLRATRGVPRSLKAKYE